MSHTLWAILVSNSNALTTWSECSLCLFRNSTSFLHSTPELKTYSNSTFFGSYLSILFSLCPCYEFKVMCNYSKTRATCTSISLLGNEIKLLWCKVAFQKKSHIEICISSARTTFLLHINTFEDAVPISLLTQYYITTH